VENKNILLGVTGGIAAYKMASVASSLTKRGHEVHVVMTESAQKFISPVTFRAITGLPVETDLFSEPEKHEVKHISLADKTDIALIGPATANIIGKIANGIADDLLTTIITAITVPVIIAPAMNVNMFNNPIIQENLDYLSEKEYKILTPSEGMLACGYVGKGRLPEPDILVEYILKGLTKKDLKGKKVLVTAGPTREEIDPVRYLTNYSSGKMGYALAKRASARGAEVKLFSGPTSLDNPIEVKTEKIKSANELYEKVINQMNEFDIIIMAAAVADFTPESISDNKIKKNNEDYMDLRLIRTKDIIKEISKNKEDDQIVVGFAAESNDLIKNARKKLELKNLDMIVANDIKNKEIFGSDESEVIIITDEKQIDVSRSSKENIANQIFDLLN